MRGTSLTKHKQTVPASQLSATAFNRPIYPSTAFAHVRRCAPIRRTQGASTPSLPRPPKRHVVTLNIAQRGSDVPPHRSRQLNPLSCPGASCAARYVLTSPKFLLPFLPGANAPFVTLLFLTCLSTNHEFSIPTRAPTPMAFREILRQRATTSPRC